VYVTVRAVTSQVGTRHEFDVSTVGPPADTQVPAELQVDVAAHPLTLGPHDAPAASVVYATFPVLGLHDPTRQGLVVSIETGAPRTQAPDASQVDVPRHLFELSPQSDPVGRSI
jgi:hypothetical protein